MLQFFSKTFIKCFKNSILLSGPNRFSLYSSYLFSLHKGLVVFYNEIQNEYISTSFSQCKKENDTVFQTFAHSLIDHRENFTQFCPNFCMPIYVEPITDTIAHKIPDCDSNFDYYCMWKPGPLKVATTLAPLSMKPCLVKSPKLNDFPSKFLVDC